MKRTIITIGRQYGSGGREIGKRVSEILGIPYYDKELIELAAKEGGMSSEVFSTMDEKPTNSLLYTMATSGSMYGGLRYTPQTELPLSDKLFILSSRVIREIAEKGSCVIIGRCGDYVLREDKDLTSVYIHAPLGKRMERIVRLYEEPVDKAEQIIQKMDKQRSQYYSYFTGRNWNDMANYHLCFSSGVLGVEASANFIVKYIEERHKNT